MRARCMAWKDGAGGDSGEERSKENKWNELKTRGERGEQSTKDLCIDVSRLFQSKLRFVERRGQEIYKRKESRKQK